jgi:hypothetical protein
VLEDNPCNDEGVFVSLALIAKKASLDAFEPRLLEVWQKIDGKVFFKRLLKSGMEPMAMNFLTMFCGHPACRDDVLENFGEELIEACMGAEDAPVVADALECLTALRTCSGSSLVFLEFAMNHAGKKLHWNSFICLRECLVVTDNYLQGSKDLSVGPDSLVCTLL